jgi:8-oxo-dGTP diphosphatase
MPGYGYAKASKAEVKAWQSVLRGYLRGRPGLTRAFVLVDSRHGILKADEEMFDLLDEAAVTYQVVLTKADKIKPAELEKVAAATAKAIAKQKFAPNQEIAKVEWIAAKEAVKLLSYEHDKNLMEQVIQLHKAKELETRALIILRHAKATLRSDWKGEEAKRPLLAEGKKQAKALVPLIAAYGPKRLVTSPWVRCHDTINPYAETRKQKLIERHQLTELGNKKRPARTQDVVTDLLGTSKSGLICSHRPALPSILAPFAQMAPKEIRKEIEAGSTLAPAEFLVLRITLSSKPKVVGVERCGLNELAS